MGTGIIVMGGCGGVCVDKFCNAGLGSFAKASLWGTSVALAAYATQAVSGAHLNPAVTAGLTVHSGFPVEEAGPYVAAQIFGAAVAGAINYVYSAAGIRAFEAKHSLTRGTEPSRTTFHGAFGMVPTKELVSPLGALAVEIYITGILFYLLLAVGDPATGIPAGAGCALVGLAVALLVAIFAPVTGAGLNPARDLGPRLVTLFTGWGSVALSSWWIYTLGPVLGAIAGGYLYKAVMSA